MQPPPYTMGCGAALEVVRRNHLKESFMCEMTGMLNREAARERVLAVVRAALDKYIPADPNQPVKDGKFWEWEELADAFDREVTAAFIEELAGLSAGASLAKPCVCPFCGSADRSGERSVG